MSYLGREEIEDIFLTVADIINENRELKEQLEYYKEQIKESRKHIDKQYMTTQNQMASILNRMLEDSEIK
ncbi:MAG: hypothetical protein ACRDB0_08365 [Paraclostridium sp.]